MTFASPPSGNPSHTDPQTITFVEYPECKPKGRQVFTKHTLPHAQFVAKLLSHSPQADKFAGSLWAPNTFGPKFTARSKYGVTSVTAFVFDVERKGGIHETEIEALVDRLDATGLEYVLTSSHSHAPPSNCRFRLVLFPSRPILPPEHEEARRRITEQLGLQGLTDPAAEDISRIFFWPSCPPERLDVSVSHHQPGTPVDVDELLSGYLAVPYEAFPTREPPEGWKYEAPEPPSDAELQKSVEAHLEALKKYRGKGADAEDAQRKAAQIKAVVKGEAFATSNFNSALWSVVNLLVWNLPPQTSRQEILQVLSPSMVEMYGDGDGPISLRTAEDVARRMIDRALEARAAQDAADEAVTRELLEAPRVLTAALTQLEQKPPATLEELAQVEEQLPSAPFAFLVPEEKFYYRDGTGAGAFVRSSPVGKDGITAYLLSIGWELERVQTALKTHSYPKVLGTVFTPRQPCLVARNGSLYLNTWTPPTLHPEPGEWTSIDKILDSLTLNEIQVIRDGELELVSQHDAEAKKYIINWLAWKVQNPAGIHGTALLFNGVQGSGKNLLATVFTHILGPENCALVTTKAFEGRFQARWLSKCFVYGDEIFNRERLADITDTLKQLLTGQTVISEDKNVREKEMKNHVSYILASNHLVPIRLDADDRRFSVFTRTVPVTEEFKTWGRSLFRNETEPTEAFMREISAFGHFLERYPVSHDLARSVYLNDSRWSIITASAPSHLAFCSHVDEHGVDGLMHDVIRNEIGFLKAEGPQRDIQMRDVFGGEHDFGPRGITTGALYRCYVQFCRQTGTSAVTNSARFGRLLGQHVPAWPHKRLKTPGGQRVWVYQVRRGADDKGGLGGPGAGNTKEARA